MTNQYHIAYKGKMAYNIESTEYENQDQERRWCEWSRGQERTEITNEESNLQSGLRSNRATLLWLCSNSGAHDE